MSSRVQRLRSRRRGERGAAMVEFALAVPVLATMVFGAIDLGRAYRTSTSVRNAAREGADFAQLRPIAQVPGTGCADPDNVRYRAQNESGVLRSAYVVTVTPAVDCPATASQAAAVAPGSTITVTVSTPFRVFTPFVSDIVGQPTIRSTVNVVVQG